MSLVATLSQSLRAKYTPKTLDKNEIRQSRYGAWDFFQRQSALAGGVMSPDVKKLIEESQGNSVVVPVFNADTVTIGNVRTCTVADAESTSGLVTLTFVTYAFGFTMTPAQYKNNDIKYQADFDHKLEQYLLKFASVLDTASVAQLNTNRNIFFPAAITNYYPVVGNALQVTAAQKDDFFNQLEAIQQTMDYYGMENIVGSTSLNPIISRLYAQGGGNSVNQSFQFAPYRWNTTNRIVPAAGVAATLYGVPDGMVAVHNRNDIDSRMNSRTGNGKIWQEVNMPIVNMRMGSYYYDDCADKSALTSGTAHLTATRVEGFQWSTDVVYMTAYNSAPSTTYSPILKAEISAT